MFDRVIGLIGLREGTRLYSLIPFGGSYLAQMEASWALVQITGHLTMGSIWPGVPSGSSSVFFL